MLPQRISEIAINFITLINIILVHDLHITANKIMNVKYTK